MSCHYTAICQVCKGRIGFLSLKNRYDRPSFRMGDPGGPWDEALRYFLGERDAKRAEALRDPYGDDNRRVPPCTCQEDG